MKTSHFFILCILLHSISFSQSQLDIEFKKLLNDNDLASAHIGFSVIDTKSQSPIYKHQDRKWFSIASSLKLITTACAWEYLGNDYRFKTLVSTDGSIVDSVLKGDLIIMGSGDPTLASSRYKESIDGITLQIVNSLKKKGIKSIQGSITFDISKFDIDPLSPKTLWLDVGNYFSGAVWPINVDENIYRVSFSRSMKDGDSTRIININPPIDIKLDNKVTIGGTSDEAFIYCAPYTTYGYIKGTLPPGNTPYTIKGAMPNPMQYFGEVLSDAIKRENIKISSGLIFKKLSTEPKTVLWVHESPSLEELVKQTNWYSLNLYSEALLRGIALEKTGHALTQNGIKIMNEFVKTLGLSSKEMNICDGSGISPSNTCSPFLMSTLLAKIKQKEWFPLFFKNLSSSGGGGTLSNMGIGTILEGKLRAKSGNMDGISSYAGYITTQSGKEVSFSIFINDFNAPNDLIKKKIEKLLIKVAEL